ncbi:MAG: DinB family protein [Dehalococcoidia bacterium]|nr:DinB family protein [Dehalococcoidia bacterium]
MPHYPLYLESGPKRRKTMVHVLDLLGCVATGPTTDAALEATPDTIRAHLRFLRRYNEPADPDAPFTTAVAEHITQGEWLGNGSPYLVFAPDLKPVTDAEIETLLRRFHGLTEELASWAAAQTPKQLDAPPEDGGRTARAILLHVLAPVGGVLSAALGGATGFSRVAGAAERGEMPVVDALRLLDAMAAERVRATTPEERTFVRQRPPPQHPKEVRTLRKALRRTLEHYWEHLAELSRRPGGPPL